jgi:hypothetical protein
MSTSSRLTWPKADTFYDQGTVRKSNLLLEGRLLQARGQDDEAVARFAEAARIEAELGEHCTKLGFTEMAHVHRYGAAGCWALAGNIYEALAVCDSLLEEGYLSQPLREHITTYSQTLRARRRQYYSGLEQEASARETG